MTPHGFSRERRLFSLYTKNLKELVASVRQEYGEKEGKREKISHNKT
jgi:hypothetical protein